MFPRKSNTRNRVTLSNGSTSFAILYVPSGYRFVDGPAMNRMPGGVNIGDGAARLSASRIRPFTRAAWALLCRRSADKSTNVFIISLEHFITS